ncbi:anthranilate synthase component I [Azospirillum sp. RWY-5-1]|uniref:Anthranilate synthase component 1 n=1 Tax=Azospirillum oleiclasticum TaxID=2735135 RepID=A0ABX2TKR0_9PROT|nr:anthranilate synthase component I [Azospirillum oleiclasticum]NYZ24826.1 anthranilate synthase component I [Azospirillum oleiclasticum]
MKVHPDTTAFRQAYDSGRPQVVWWTLVSDLETPVSAYLKLADGRPFGFLLESAERGAGSRRDRYSVIGFKPDLVWRCRRAQAAINRRALFDANAYEPVDEAPLASLRRLIDESRIDMPPELPPMASGLFGYLTYDMVRLMERLPDDNADELDIPDAILTRPSIIAIFDSHTDSITLVTPVWPQAGVDAEAAYARARERLADAVADLERPLPYRREPRTGAGAALVPTSNTSKDEYMAMVERAKEYIRAGDIFQCVPSQRIRIPFKLSPLALYRTLRRLNPSPFLFHLDFGDLTIVGSSPEILVRLRDGKVTIRPIAGTRRRGATPAEDEALAADLLGDPKELAEHLMLLDLGRNDVGRVAKIGTVKVTQKMAVEYYSHVMHIVSNVEGELDPAHTALDALFAGFPAGTVSGAPKIRAMEIIDELEKARRGVYAGCVGYFGASGAMDTCIALRTAVVKDGTLYVQAGGGVVADSDPEAEYQESMNKAMALIRAAEEAVRSADA